MWSVGLFLLASSSVNGGVVLIIIAIIYLAHALPVIAEREMSNITTSAYERR